MRERSTSLWLHWRRNHGGFRLPVRLPRPSMRFAAALAAKLRGIAPYAAIELVLPGGSIVALLLWLYRRHRVLPVFPTQEILSLL
jgi:hypothetical protein